MHLARPFAQEKRFRMTVRTKLSVLYQVEVFANIARMLVFSVLDPGIVLG